MKLQYLVCASLAICTPMGQAQPTDNPNANANSKAPVFSYWTKERRHLAQPRDMVIDERGLGYLRGRNGNLQPHGHDIAALASEKPNGKPAGGNDNSPPTITNMSPAGNTTIGSSATFQATVKDPSGIKSVAFVITPEGGLSQSFTPSGSGDLYQVGLSGFSNGNWSWTVVARDNASKGGNTGESPPADFTVDSGGEGGGGSGGGGGTGGNDVVANDPWTNGGAVQNAAGRIYFEMPSERRVRGKITTIWDGYVCSGTVVNDSTSGRSIIVTAAHCVYEDVLKQFARNVLFIPNQAGTTGARTDSDCSNDPIGCWAPEFGVVDTNWTSATFPDNIPWDYAYYVIPDTGAHQGANSSSPALDGSVTPMDISFDAPIPGDRTHALGYSYSDDPNFMFCAEAMTTEGSDNWWLPSCDLSGGSSGGPWTQATGDLGTGPVMSVNSWGYTTGSGMAGPFLNGTSASCLFDLAKTGSPISLADGQAGLVGCSN